MGRVNTAQKRNFSNKEFFSKFDQIRRKLRIWSLYWRNPQWKTSFFCAVEYVITENVNEITDVDFKILKNNVPSYTISNDLTEFFILNGFYMLSQILRGEFNVSEIFKAAMYISKHVKDSSLFEAL